MLYVFFALFASFLISVSVIILPFLRNKVNFYVLAVPTILVFVLGILLLGLISGKEIDKELKKYFKITGVSAIVLFAGSILHNVFYGFAVVAAGIKPLSLFLGLVSTLIFIITIFVAPVTFLFGAVKSILILLKKESPHKEK